MQPANETIAAVPPHLRTDLEPIMDLLLDPTVRDIMVNCDGGLWVQRLGERQQCAGKSLSDGEVLAILRCAAKASGKLLNEDEPTITANLPWRNARIAGAIAPMVSRPTLAIRIPPTRVFTLADYVKLGLLSEQTADLLANAVRYGRTILIGGQPGSGKSTLLAALLKELAEIPGERLVLAEETPELLCSVPNRVRFDCGGAGKSLREAVRLSLVFNPTRIVVGELLGGEAYEWRRATVTGLRGCSATLHAASAEQIPGRLQSLAAEVEPVSGQLIAEAVDLCVHLTQDVDSPAGIRVTGIVEVCGYSEERAQWIFNKVL